MILTGTVSFQDERKGFTYLIQALGRLAESGLPRQLTLAIYGQLNSTPILPNGIKLLNLGYLANSEKLVEAYNLADVFIIPSLEDNLPNVVIESMACGTPVVGFRTGGIPDMIKKKKNGFLVEQKDVDGLVKGINWVLSLGKDANNVRVYCRQWVLDTFSEKKIAKQYYELFSQAAQKKRRALDLLKQGTSENNSTVKIKLIEQAQTLDPFAPEILRAAAFIAIEKNQPEEAKNLLKRALDHNPGDAMSLLAYGTLLNNGNQPDEDFIERASAYLDKFPDDKGVEALLLQNQNKYWDELAGRTPRTTISAGNGQPQITIIVICTVSNIHQLDSTLRSATNSNTKLHLEFLIINFSQTSVFETVSPNLYPSFPEIIGLDLTEQQPSQAMGANMGMILGSGNFCLLLNSGDQLGDIKNLVTELENNQTLAVAYGNSLLISDENCTWPSLQKFGDFFLLEPGLTSFNHLKYNYSIGPTPIWRRNLYRDIGYWDTRLEKSADQDFWLRTSRKKKLAYLPVVTGRALVNNNDDRKIPEDLKQPKEIIRHYRSLTNTSSGAREQRQNDILNYVNDNLKGLNRFLGDLTSLLKNGDYLTAIHLYDRIRWDMLPNPELKEADKTIDKLRHTLSISSGAT